MKKQPQVCIVIVNWNGGEKLWQCISSLVKITKYKNYKTIIVDNGSTDGSPEKIEKNFKDIAVIKTGKNLGFTQGTNLGWTYAFKNFNPDYICDMNNDIITVQKDWLDVMVNALESNENYGICGNKLLSPDQTLQLLYLGRPIIDKEPDNGQYDFTKEVPAVGGANMLIKRSVIKHLGSLDENFFYGPDDIDFCLRAAKANFKIIYTGFSKSIHLGSYSYVTASKDFIFPHQTYGMMLFAFRWDSIGKKALMVLNQFVRCFFTRRDINYGRSITNIHFHKTFMFRLKHFFPALYNALRNYKSVKNTQFQKKLAR